MKGRERIWRSKRTMDTTMDTTTDTWSSALTSAGYATNCLDESRPCIELLTAADAEPHWPLTAPTQLRGGRPVGKAHAWITYRFAR